MTPVSDPQKLLRGSLRGNAVFSLVSGLTFTFAAGRIAPAIGVDPAGIVTFVGVNLLGFAVALAILASRQAIPLPYARAVVALDVGWVLGTAGVFALGLLNETGNVAAIAVADVVLLLAILQAWGVRRARSAGAGGTPRFSARRSGALPRPWRTSPE